MHTKKSTSGRTIWPLLGFVFVLGIIALAFGFQFGTTKMSKNTEDYVPTQVATVLPAGRTIPAFKLTANTGKPFTNANLKGHWSFVFFGFTNCPHICPTTMAEFAKIYKILADQGVTEPQYWLISIDPARDTVKRVNTYVKAFNKNFNGATGDEKEVENLAKALGAVYMKAYPKADKDAENYQIDHSGTIVLVNPKGEIKAFFSMPHEAQTIAGDYLAITKQKG